MMFLTLNALPEKTSMHALFLGYREGCYAFEVTGHGTALIPETLVEREADCGAFQKGEDLRLMRNENVLAVRRPK